MPAIFISYRRSDSQDVTGRIYDRLVARYTQPQVFKDVDNIPLGVSFPMHLRQMLCKASAVLVIIGPGWVTATDEQGRRRLDDPNDFVRLEVEIALRANMPVVPVLVSNARMPQASELPPSLRKLTERNGMPVRPDPDFNNDIGRLFSGLDHLEKILYSRPVDVALARGHPIPTQPGPRRKRDSRKESAEYLPRPASEPQPRGFGGRIVWGVSGLLALAVALVGWFAFPMLWSGPSSNPKAFDPGKPTPVAVQGLEGTSVKRPKSAPKLSATSTSVQALEGTAPERPAPLHAPFGEAKAREAQQAWATYLGRKVEETVDLGGGVTIEFVLIAPGTFTIGSPKEELERGDDEDQHEVTITKPFYLGKYAVTQQQYQRLMGKNPSYFSAGSNGADRVADLDTARFPVEQVSWGDAVAFCAALAQKTGLEAGLPSEAQWEYACRAGTTTPFHFGSSLNGSAANCNGDFPYGTTEKGTNLKRPSAVGSYQPNAFGLYDMHGNVWQWCDDSWGLNRVLRGGGWRYRASDCRAAHRSGYAPSLRYDDLGFRVAQVLSGKQAN